MTWSRRHTWNPLAYLAAALIVVRQRREGRALQQRLSDAARRGR